MNFARRFCLSLWAIGILAAAAAAQAPDEFAPFSQVNPGTSNAAAGMSNATPAEQMLMAAQPNDGASALNGSGWFGGAGFYLLQPYFQNNPAYTILIEKTNDTTLDPRNPNTQTVAESVRRVEINHQMVAAPMISLGYIDDDGLGFRVRSWGFQEGTSQTANLAPFNGAYKIGMKDGHPVIVASGSLSTITSATPLGLQAFGDTLSIQHGPEATTFNVTSKLAVQVGDIEALQRFRVGDWSLLVAGGVRLVRLDQTYNAYDAQGTSAAELRTLNSSYNFEGLGPTLAFEVRRPIANSGVNLYSQFRGAAVYGAANQNAVFSGPELRNNDPNPQYATQRNDRAIPIVDLETGLEYGRTVGRTWLFGQVALVGQEWFNAGSASRSTMLNTATTGRPVQGGAPLDSNIAFLGLTFRVGLNY